MILDVVIGLFSDKMGNDREFYYLTDNRDRRMKNDIHRKDGGYHDSG